MEHRQRVGLFFLLAHATTWGLSAIVTYMDVSPVVKGIGSILLHYGPALAAIVLALAFGGKSGLRDLLSGLGMWRVGLLWYLFVFLFPVVVHLLSVWVFSLLGGGSLQYFSANEVPAGNPWLLVVPVFIVIFFQAGLAEEIGWRGYALPGLQTRYSPLVSSLILGVVWTFWHYHPQNFSSLVELGPWYLFSVLPLTILMTWVYNNTGGSVFLVALFHTASNVSDWIVPIHPGITSAGSVTPFVIYGVLLWIVALIVIRIQGSEKLQPALHPTEMR